MKRFGLSLISVSLLLICVVIFQNCGSFDSAPTTSTQATSITCPAGFIQGMNGACVPVSAGECTVSAMQPCTIANGTGAQMCSSSNIWGACQATSCNTGFVVTNGACVASGTTTAPNTTACNGAFNLQFSIQSGTIPTTFTENSSGAFTITWNGQSLGTGNCSISGSPGTASYAVVIGSVTASCAGSYTITNNKTTITGQCNTGSSTPTTFTAIQQ